MNYDDVELMKVKIKANKNIEFFIKDEVLDQFKEEFGNIKLNGLFFSFDNDNSSENSFALLQLQDVDIKNNKIEIEANSEEGTVESDRILKKIWKLMREMW